MKIIADTNIAANGCGCHKSLSPFSGCIFSCLHFHLKVKRLESMQINHLKYKTSVPAQMCILMERCVYEFDTYTHLGKCVYVSVDMCMFHPLIITFFCPPEMFRTQSACCIYSQRDEYSGCALSGVTKTDQPSAYHTSVCVTGGRTPPKSFLAHLKERNKQMPLMPGFVACDAVNWEAA